MSFEVSNPRAMLAPVANISNTGKVPNSISGKEIPSHGQHLKQRQGAKLAHK